jgi:hypothetical protein
MLRLIRDIIAIAISLFKDRQATKRTLTRGVAYWKALFVQNGDMPSFHKAGENVVLSKGNPTLRNFPGALLKVTQWIDNVERDGEMGGEVEFTLYQTAEQATQTYTRLTSQANDTQTIENIGERAVIRSASSDALGTSIEFVRCRATVRVWGTWQTDLTHPRGMFHKEDVVSYAKRLDQRLTALVCVKSSKDVLPIE